MTRSTSIKSGRSRAARSERRAPTRFRPGWNWALAAVFLLAWVWRIAYLSRLAATPLAESLTADARDYWGWSAYLLREGPLGTNPFFLGPLYPYVLAMLRAIGADGIGAILQVQAVAGALAAVLIADSARRLTTPGWGLCCGIVAALYRMAVFFDGLVLMESLLFLLESALLWLVVRRARPELDARSLALAGLLIGLLAAGRSTAALLLLPTAAFLVPWTAPARIRLRGLLALILGFAAVAAPIAARNRIVGGEWILFTYNFGYNLCIGNNPEATGTFMYITGTQQTNQPLAIAVDGGTTSDGREFIRATTGRDLSPLESSRFWTERAVAYVREHPGPSLRLTGQKLLMLWNRREYAQIENADQYEGMAGPLGLPFVGTFLLVGSLGLAGLVPARRAGPAGRWLVGYVVVLTLGTLPFFVTDRYRLHLVPALMLLMALALDRGVGAWRAGTLRGRLGLALTLAIAVGVVSLPLPHLSRGKYEWAEAADLGTRWMEQGRPDLAIVEFERAVAFERGRPLTAATTAEAVERAELYYNYGNALRRLGRLPEAVPWLERAGTLAPKNATIAYSLANAWLASGRERPAESLYVATAGMAFGEGYSRLGMGWLAARRGNLAAAEGDFAAAAQAAPTLWEAWMALMRIQVQQGKAKEAGRTLARARDAGLPEPAATAYAALVAAAAGDRAAAERGLVSLPPEATRVDSELGEVLRVTRSLMARR